MSTHLRGQTGLFQEDRLNEKLIFRITLPLLLRLHDRQLKLVVAEVKGSSLRVPAVGDVKSILDVRVSNEGTVACDTKLDAAVFILHRLQRLILHFSMSFLSRQCDQMAT